ncbi:MAG: OmpH family outer membrane protein [Pseudomonadota bacterium]|jgi:outer membrane protein
MKTRLLISSIALCCFSVIASDCQAEVRIATVDVARIINEAPDAKAKKKELDSASEEAKKKLEARGKDLQALKTKLEGQKVSAESKEAEAFREKARDFERMRADMKADLEKKYMKVNKELSDKVMAKIETYAKANNYDLVIDKSDKYRGPVLFGKPSADITDDILDSL